MLLSLLLPTLGALAAPTASGFLLPGPTACTAPSGRPGDCVLPSDCPAARGPHSNDPCGYNRKQGNAFLFCCERQQAEPPRIPSGLTPPKTTAPSPKTLPTDCGLGLRSVNSRAAVPNIAYGERSARHGWPWAAVLGFTRPDGTVSWQCGGVLLGTHHVLTAGHCVPFDDTVLVVRLGEHNLTAATDPARQDRHVRRAVRHPEFKGSRHDLALLQLDAPVRLGDAVQPVCLPEPDQTLVGRAGFVVGWGRLRFNAPSADVLQEALVVVEDADDCEKSFKNTRRYDSNFRGGFGGGVLCAADPMPRTVSDGNQLATVAMDACGGDSGGPLSVQRPDGRFQLAGLVLEGMGCGNPDHPGLYTRVANYVKWIRREVARS